jgi:hypothetical protein
MMGLGVLTSRPIGSLGLPGVISAILVLLDNEGLAWKPIMSVSPVASMVSTKRDRRSAQGNSPY